ncbi:hypothetical protein ACFO5T_00430 [Dokdonia genika]|uniref:Uncharacterized protein n=1 Tax=Dokdonia genika TaxID=308113 RepID=A0ABV9L4Z6_9FLAO
MGLFDIFKSKKEIKSDYIPEIGELIFSAEHNDYACRGKINLTNFEYKTEIVFPSVSNNITDYQLAYFKRINDNIKDILDFASKMPDSKIVLSKCRVDSVSIPNRENNSYDMDAEIVVTQKEKANIYGRSIYSLIMDELKVAKIITIV